MSLYYKMESLTEFTIKRLNERITDLDDKIVFLNALHKVKDKMLRDKKAVITNLNDKISLLNSMNTIKDNMLRERSQTIYELSAKIDTDDDNA